MLKELVASSSDHRNEGHKLLEIALCIPVAVQCLHDFVHSLLVFDFLKGEKQAAKAGEDHSTAQTVTCPHFSNALMAESLFRHIPNILWLFPACGGALSCAPGNRSHSCAAGKGHLEPLGAKLSPRAREGNFPSIQPTPQSAIQAVALILLLCRAGAKDLMPCCVNKPLHLCWLPVGDRVNGVQWLLDAP